MSVSKSQTKFIVKLGRSQEDYLSLKWVIWYCICIYRYFSADREYYERYVNLTLSDTTHYLPLLSRGRLYLSFFFRINTLSTSCVQVSILSTGSHPRISVLVSRTENYIYSKWLFSFHHLHANNIINNINTTGYNAVVTRGKWYIFM